ncbi:type III pantothenate kinase [Flavobacterium sp. NKUCC04_CG]|uniref:type III pantothenate kinase n=1 Tax=Flavobacterium sp. NKUCC04_CG TaxID=2842121 RepID=UPI001C5ABE7B|nr:type III pantothenate kinase [Flavobacterium sp. NKUCC04_CG]MBW3518166.1 type III pantothenate kinase [Flavobacterium sp. NKUCC04_CG]
MLLVVDIGNTRTKVALFENDRIIEIYILERENFLKNFKKILKNFNTLPKIVLSSVGKLDTASLNWLQAHTDLLEITIKTTLPFQNDYSTPQTLGIDRLVLAAGATLQYPAQNRLVIDAGTCVTYDFITKENHYLGGAISPGIALRYQSLNTYTAKLPLLQLQEPADLIGNSTAESIHSGVVNGLTAEIDQLIDLYIARFQDLTIILTGGDGVFLAKRLKNTIFAHSNFLLESLNSLHQYTIENDKKNLSRL